MMFASGHSSGGFFTLSLMEIMPVFRAYAIVGCYSQYQADLDVIDCSNTYHYRPLNSGVHEGVPPADHPSPVLYMFGENDTTFASGYSADCNAFSKCNKTLVELTSRNRAATPLCPTIGDHYMVCFDRQHFLPTSGSGVEVQFQLYHGDHSWPPEDAQPDELGNEWVIDYFKSKYRRFTVSGFLHEASGLSLGFWTTREMEYTLLHSINLQEWESTGYSVTGNGEMMTIHLGPSWASAPTGKRFFKILRTPF
jgi:hypothetical protein